MDDRNPDQRDSSPGRSAFYPDEDLLSTVEQHIRGGWIEPAYEVTIRQVGGDETVRLLVLAPDATLEEVHQGVRSGLGIDEPDNAYLEPYFWLFWRGWLGMLDAPTARLLPVRPDLLDKLVAGVQLRGDDLKVLATGLGWFHAMNAGDWGDTGSWNRGTLSTPHSKSRRVVRDYVLSRMAELYGEDYDQL